MLCTKLLEMDQRESFRGLYEHRKIIINKYPNLIEAISDRSSVIFSYYDYPTIPYADKPSEGIFQFNLSHRKNDMLLNFLQGLYIKSGCIDQSSMVVKMGIEVLAVCIDIRIIQTDGNLFALCVAGINAVIADIGIKILFLPKIFTYALVAGRFISDPDANELLAAEWTYTIVMKSSREMILFEKLGDLCDVSDVMAVVDRAYNDYLPDQEFPL